MMMMVVVIFDTVTWFQAFLSNTIIYKQIYLNHRVDLNGYITLLRDIQLEPNHQIQLSAISRILAFCGEGALLPSREYGQHILISTIKANFPINEKITNVTNKQLQEESPWHNGLRTGLQPQSKRVRTSVVLLRSLSDYHSWEKLKPPYPPAIG